MVYRLDDDQVGFPDPGLATRDGMLAVGGSLEPEWLLNAYYMGIFPWFTVEGTPFWFSLDPRMVLLPKDFQPSKSLRRQMSSGRFEVRIDTCFRQVIENCAKVSRKEECGESWITDDFIEAYCKLHELGFAHSFETFEDGRLVGGLYGVSLCDFFSGESMFHLVTDASKVAFARLVSFAALHGFRFIDAQQQTNHLASLCAKPIERKLFLNMLKDNDINHTYRGRWCNNSVVILLGGNEGERVQLLMWAIVEIGKRIGTVSRLSAIYETAPWGFEAEQNFLNIAVVADTDLTAHEVLAEALKIEKDLGRIRNEEPLTAKENKSAVRKYSSRPIDIDLIFFNDDTVDTDDLTIPHPRMQQRRFVLAPLEEIMPEYRHPKLRKTVRQLLEECDDTGEVKKYF